MLLAGSTRLLPYAAKRPGISFSISRRNRTRRSNSITCNQLVQDGRRKALSRPAPFCGSAPESCYNSGEAMPALRLLYTIPLGYTYNNSCFQKHSTPGNAFQSSLVLANGFRSRRSFGISWIDLSGSERSQIFTVSPIYTAKRLGDFCANW